jgi:glycosyltransferase involved in cell wall biosynthesis
LKILFVRSGNTGEIKSYIKEQAESLAALNVEIEFFVINGKGIIGYLKNLFALRQKILLSKIELVHAHYGLSGFLSILQRKAPVVITFHGSDINIWWVRIISSIAARFADKSIFVSEHLAKQLKLKSYDVIPCGVDRKTFSPIDKYLAREKLGFDVKKNIILFTSSFDNKVKNFPLAKKALELTGISFQIIELKGFSRGEINLLLNAADLVLLTSHSEGSPQIIKEAMACNCPIVATDVGDIKEVISGTKNCYITSFNPTEVARKIKQVLEVKERADGSDKIEKFDNRLIAEKIISVYKEILQKN